MSSPLLSREFYDRPTLRVARDLLGARLVRISEGGRLSGLITETEAYIGEEDLACHARHGRTPRTAVMYGPPGHAYVYFTYGNHWMLNIVTEEPERPAAVLIRALAPTRGLAAMRRRRGVADERHLCSGPGRLCQALGISAAHDGLALTEPPFRLLARTDEVTVAVGPRIGITKAADNPWRYGLSGSRFLSKPFSDTRR